MKPDLSPFLENAALTRACSIGLKEDHTSLVVQLTALILCNAKKSAAKSIRSVSFSSPKNLAVIVKYDPKKPGKYL